MLLQSETKIEPVLMLIAVLIKYILHLLVFDSFQGSKPPLSHYFALSEKWVLMLA